MESMQHQGTHRKTARLHALGLTVVIGLSACLFDSTSPPWPTNSSTTLDTIYPGSAVPTRIYNLYQPQLDSDLVSGQASTPQVWKPVNVRDFYSGRLVQYRITAQRFKTWSAELEFKWNYFLLQSGFLFPPDSLPDTAGLERKTASMYAALHVRDRFTRYFDSADAAEAWKAISSSTLPGALGVRVRLLPGDTLAVEQVVAGSPAGRAGVEKGARILLVNDSVVYGDSAMERFSRFTAGESGTALTLTVSGPKGASMVSLVKEPVDFPSVLVDSLNGVGYIAVFSFTPTTLPKQSTYTEFRAALTATRSFPITILDLRDNGGGALDLALKMSDEIVASGVIIKQRQRQWSDEAGVPLLTSNSHLAKPGGMGEGRKFLLMADTLTASASEIFLSALNEGAGTPIYGSRTFGKGVGQTVRNTPGHGLALVTFLKFTSRSDLDYHGKGLPPTFPDTSEPIQLLANAVAKARSLAGLRAAKASGSAETGLRKQAATLEWNRRQGVTPGVRDFGE